MFQNHWANQIRPLLWTTLIALFAMVAAMAVTGWLILEVRREQTAIDEMLRLGAPRHAGSLQILSGELRWQLPLTALVLVVLMTTTITLIFVVRAYVISEKSLRDTRTLSFHTFASIDQGLITTDVDGVITSANPQSQQLLGAEESLVERSLRALNRDGNPLAEISQRVLRSGKAEHDQDFTLQRNGQMIRIRVHCNLLRNDADKVSGVVLHLRDVTERHLIEEQLRRMERFMGLGTVAASLHHEINNPLSALSLHLQLLDERLADQSDPEVQETIKILRTELARITAVLSGFREYASVPTINREPTDFEKLIQRTVDLIRPQAERQRVHITVKSPLGDAHLSIDGGLLEQVVLNLILNAIEAMPNGGELPIVCDYDANQIRLTVADSGTGIPTALRSRVFDPFFTTKPSGSGMGLAFCDKIVREHGGQIYFETGHTGTVFHVNLPRSTHG